MITIMAIKQEIDELRKLVTEASRREEGQRHEPVSFPFPTPVKPSNQNPTSAAGKKR